MVKPFEHPESIDWEPSEHKGLLFYKDGVKCWYRCSGCCYINDRLYHAKMHYTRIHVNKGRPAVLKRKYEARANVSSSGEQEQQKKNNEQFDYRRTLLKRGLAMVMTSLGLKKRKHRKRKRAALGTTTTTTTVEKPPLAKQVEAKADAEADAEDTTVHWTSFFKQDGGEDAALHQLTPSQTSSGKKRAPVVMVTAPSSAFAAVRELANQQTAALFVFGNSGMTSLHAPLPATIESAVYFDSLQHTSGLEEEQQEQPLVVAEEAPNACDHNPHQVLQVNLFA